MIRKIQLNNFKCFSNRNIQCGPLTLLTGFNGGGKSTVLQSLLLLHQSLADGIESAALRQTLPLNGPLVSLGSLRDVVDKVHGGHGFSLGVSTNDISIQWAFNNPEPLREALAVPIDYVNWTLTGESERAALEEAILLRLPSNEPSERIDKSGILIPADLRTLRPATELFEALGSLRYVPADRLGPEQTYPLEEPQQHEVLGPRAERAVGSLFALSDLTVDPELRHPSRLSTLTFPRQVESWLADLFPGAVIEAHKVANANLVTLGIRTNDATDLHRPQHVGFGMTYVLPVLVAILSSQKGDVVIIENPEAHLHPRAQARIGALCARAAAAGVQVMVETHSDHVLNGIRVAVHQGHIKAEDVVVLFFSPSGDEPVQTLTVDRRGRIAHWPQGFFDESERLLDTLLEPAPTSGNE